MRRVWGDVVEEAAGVSVLRGVMHKTTGRRKCRRCGVRRDEHTLAARKEWCPDGSQRIFKCSTPTGTRASMSLSAAEVAAVSALVECGTWGEFNRLSKSAEVRRFAKRLLAARVGMARRSSRF